VGGVPLKHKQGYEKRFFLLKAHHRTNHSSRTKDKRACLLLTSLEKVHGATIIAKIVAEAAS